MPHQLNFALHHYYKTSDLGITIEVILSSGSRQFQTEAKVDTGSQLCLFEREIGEYLGIDIESGLRKSLSTLAGNLTAFGHEVTLQTLGLTFDTFIYFAESKTLQRNLLGRQGWLQLVRLAVIDYDSEIYLSRYDEPLN